MIVPDKPKQRQTFKDVKFPNYSKEIFLDSDIKGAVLSGAPSDIPRIGC
jgi:hypothetical protein